jgi:GTP-binding protein Era
VTEIDISPAFKAGYVTILGAPNVGKSTLMNSVLGQKISIVTSKPQTTRHKILGILSAPTHQIVFLDTPGLITPRYRLQEVMMTAASGAIADADALMFMLDAQQVRSDGGIPSRHPLFTTLRKANKPAFLLLNKIDLVSPAELPPLITACAGNYPFQGVMPVSALTGKGIEEIIAAVLQCLPEHPPYYPLDIVSEHSQRFFVAEIIREKIFLHYREEIPYSTTVDIVEFKEREEGKWFISADVVVERDSQKGILIGNKGSMLKKIGQMARKEVEEFLEHPVYLELHVKVRAKWREKDAWLKRLGYN